jgi:hypothetical protein
MRRISCQCAVSKTERERSSLRAHRLPSCAKATQGSDLAIDHAGARVGVSPVVSRADLARLSSPAPAGAAGIPVTGGIGPCLPAPQAEKATEGDTLREPTHRPSVLWTAATGVRKGGARSPLEVPRRAARLHECARIRRWLAASPIADHLGQLVERRQPPCPSRGLHRSRASELCAWEIAVGLVSRLGALTRASIALREALPATSTSTLPA